MPSLYSCFYSPTSCRVLFKHPSSGADTPPLSNSDLSPASILVNSTSPLQMQHIPCLTHQGVEFVPEVADIAGLIRERMYLNHAFQPPQHPAGMRARSLSTRSKAMVLYLRNLDPVDSAPFRAHPVVHTLTERQDFGSPTSCRNRFPRFFLSLFRLSPLHLPHEDLFP